MSTRPKLTPQGFIDYGATDRANPTSPRNLLGRLLDAAWPEIKAVIDGTPLADDLQRFIDNASKDAGAKPEPTQKKD